MNPEKVAEFEVMASLTYLLLIKSYSYKIEISIIFIKLYYR